METASACQRKKFYELRACGRIYESVRAGWSGGPLVVESRFWDTRIEAAMSVCLSDTLLCREPQPQFNEHTPDSTHLISFLLN